MDPDPSSEPNLDEREQAWEEEVVSKLAAKASKIKLGKPESTPTDTRMSTIGTAGVACGPLECAADWQ